MHVSTHVNGNGFDSYLPTHPNTYTCRQRVVINLGQQKPKRTIEMQMLNIKASLFLSISRSLSVSFNFFLYSCIFCLVSKENLFETDIKVLQIFANDC